MRRLRATLISGFLVAGSLGVPGLPQPVSLPGFPGTLPSLQAQQTPPPPRPPRPIEFPALERFTLPNGIHVVVMEYGTQPVASVRLYHRGGGSLAPADRAGLDDLAATVLTRGTTTRSAVEIFEAIEGVGGSLTASSGPDFVNVSATVLTRHLEVAFELLADVARNASFPEDEVEQARRHALSGLQAQLGQPEAVATRLFRRLVYRHDHPYGVSPTPETVTAITREDLVRFRDRALQPEGALLLVAGAVERDRVLSLAERHLGDWVGAPAPAPGLDAPAAPEETRIYLVHGPGSVQSLILAGQLAVAGNDLEVAGIEVANRILGGGPDARLFRILHEEKDWTDEAFSGVTRPVGTGVFQASAEVRTSATDSAVVEILHQMRRIGTEPIPTEEMDAARNYLAGSLPLQLETASQVAERLASALLLGRDVEEVSRFQERIRGVTPADVRAAGVRMMRPERSVVVVVGDATEILDGLEAIAPVTLLDLRGEELDRSGVMAPVAAAVPWDATRLEEGVRRYELRFNGNLVGSVTYRMEREGDAWLATTTVSQAMGGGQETVLVFDATDFTPRSLRQNPLAAGLGVEVDLAVVEGRIVGQANLPAPLGGARDVNHPLNGLLFPGMDEFAMAASELAEGVRFRIPYLDVVQGQAIMLDVRVIGREQVEVPAGSFDTWKVEVGTAQGTLTLFLRAEGPHVLVKQLFPGQPVTLELTGISPL